MRKKKNNSCGANSSLLFISLTTRASGVPPSASGDIFPGLVVHVERACVFLSLIPARKGSGNLAGAVQLATALGLEKSQANPAQQLLFWGGRGCGGSLYHTPLLSPPHSLNGAASGSHQACPPNGN